MVQTNIIPRTPAGTKLNCKGWVQEAALRMLLNNLDPAMMIVADGTAEAAKRLSRVLSNDPGIGVIGHADTGYKLAKQTTKEFGLGLEERVQ